VQFRIADEERIKPRSHSYVAIAKRVVFPYIPDVTEMTALSEIDGIPQSKIKQSSLSRI